MSPELEGTDISVLRQLLAWRLSGQRALLATVVRTWGSSPRPPGAMMALREDGRLVGSVSGGCIEDDLADRYSMVNGRGRMAGPLPELVCYGVSADEAHRFGLPCGGTLELLIEFEPDIGQLQALLQLLDSGALVRRRVSRRDASITLEKSAAPAQVRFDGDHLEVTLGPSYRMLLIGAGALAQYLATMALFNGFDVTLCDPRRDYLAAWSVAGVKTTCDMPDDAVIVFQADRRSCIVALSHDPKLDDLALLEALHGPAFYVGAIGSRRNSASRRERLATHFGASPESLARLHGPVGIHIGSKTPAEIAVSIMAEILATKNGVLLPLTLQVDHAKNSLQAA
ncbi:XdhC family protein [Herbaspirillum sp. alder98]|uniref:XdhC family protein n=1 Tax=Herbaspirillum sp. alder98 TaxID=2913096 RepID=UPI001CD8AB64|nr:XdhC family protein [Herbaspirillum sp. alder98]MCA1323776.1 XdhC family protein [Herbaspirillum sp. alder98]